MQVLGIVISLIVEQNNYRDYSIINENISGKYRGTRKRKYRVRHSLQGRIGYEGTKFIMVGILISLILYDELQWEIILQIFFAFCIPVEPITEHLMVVYFKDQSYRLILFPQLSF